MPTRNDLQEQAPERPVYTAPLKNRRPFLPRRSRNRLFAVGATLAILIGTAGGYVFTQRHQATEVTLDDAVAGFRARASSAPARPQPSAPAEEDRGIAAPLVPEVAEERRSEPVTGVEAADPSVAEGPYRSPEEGVYVYRATGGERISIFGASHDYPERVYATITHLDGCLWEHRNEVIEEHVDIRTMCSSTDGLFQHDQTREVEFLGQRDSIKSRCDPPQLQHAPGEEIGARSTATCSDGEGNDATLTRTYLGHEPSEVGGQMLDAVRIRIDATFTGKAEGSSEDHFWVSPSTGLPYRWDRTVDTVTDAGWGAQVTYQEEASFVLESLEPRR